LNAPKQKELLRKTPELKKVFASAAAAAKALPKAGRSHRRAGKSARQSGGAARGFPARTGMIESGRSAQ